MKYGVLVLSLLLPLCACDRAVVNRGYDIETAEFGKIVIGRDRADDVYRLLGSPTTRSSVLGKNGEYSWYYAAKRLDKLGFMEPREVYRKVCIITFDRNHVVKSVRASDYEVAIKPVGESTKVYGRTKGVVKETFGSMGKYYKSYAEK